MWKLIPAWGSPVSGWWYSVPNCEMTTGSYQMSPLRSTWRIASIAFCCIGASDCCSNAGQPSRLAHVGHWFPGPRLVEEVVAHQVGLALEALRDVAPRGGVVVLEADAVGAGRFAQKLSKARLRPGLER